jgi:ion channel
MAQTLTGLMASIACIVIHAAVMTVVVRVAQLVSAKAAAWPSLVLIATMVATVSVLMIAHLLEVFVWAWAYAIVGAAPAEADVLYFAFVNYTTLGYGDVIPVARWRLLGPATAMCGVLMFGWSTAVIFEVLRKALAYRRIATGGVPATERKHK